MRNFPGFDFIRILAASAVVFSHSFLIGEGEEANEPFQAAPGELLGVSGGCVFFILSGLLISESARRSPGLLSFMKKRVRRIFPAFVLCNLALVLLVAPVFAREGAAGFLADRNTWSYLAKVLSFWHSTLYYPSVAFYPPEGPDPWMPNVVNGVLWTIRQEFTCYLFVAAMMLAGLLGRPAVAIGAAAAAVLVLVPALQVTEYLGGLAFVAPSFVAGMALCELPAGHRARGPLAALSLALLAALAFGYAGWAKLAPVLFPALDAYPLLWLGLRD
jgi:peptidoglycan/LPS O-acetylase OafA/YrhL